MVGFGLGWAVKGGDGRVEAQAPHAPFMMQRIYTGTDGLSHVENIELDAQSVMEEITGMSVRGVSAWKLRRLARRSRSSLHHQSDGRWTARGG